MNTEELVLRVRADGRGVKETFSGIGKESDRLELSTRKASATMRTFVAELSQARTGADVASAAMNAFSKVLGTTLAGTAVVMAGKVIIDAFQKVSESVNRAKDSLAAAQEEIAKMGAVKGLADGAAQANLLAKAASEAEKSIKEIEKSKLQNFIAELRGAKDELRAMAEEARNLSLELQKTALERGAGELSVESRRTEVDRAAAAAAEKFKPQIDAAREYLRQIESTFDADIKNAKTKEEADKLRFRRQDAQNKLDQTIIDQQAEAAKAGAAKEEELRKKALQEENKLRDQEQEIKDRARSEDMEEFQREIDKRNEQTKRESAEFYSNLEAQKKREEEKFRLEKEAADLAIKKLDLEERLIEQRKQVVQAEGRVATEVSRQGGTGRGPGQKPTSFEVGMQKRMEKAAQDQAYKLREAEIDRMRGGTYNPETGRYENDGVEMRTSRYEINKELERMATQARRAETQQVYDDAKNAKAGAQATEETLRQVQDLLKTTLDKITSYAHAS